MANSEGRVRMNKTLKRIVVFCKRLDCFFLRLICDQPNSTGCSTGREGKSFLGKFCFWALLLVYAILLFIPVVLFLSLPKSLTPPKSADAPEFNVYLAA